MKLFGQEVSSKALRTMPTLLGLAFTPSQVVASERTPQNQDIASAPPISTPSPLILEPFDSLMGGIPGMEWLIHQQQDSQRFIRLSSRHGIAFPSETVLAGNSGGFGVSPDRTKIWAITSRVSIPPSLRMSSSNSSQNDGPRTQIETRLYLYDRRTKQSTSISLPRESLPMEEAPLESDIMRTGMVRALGWMSGDSMAVISMVRHRKPRAPEVENTLKVAIVGYEQGFLQAKGDSLSFDGDSTRLVGTSPEARSLVLAKSVSLRA